MMPSHNKAQKNVAKALATTVVASVLAPTSMAVAAALPSPADVTKLASQVATPDVVAAALEVGGTASGKAILGAIESPNATAAMGARAARYVRERPLTGASAIERYRALYTRLWQQGAPKKSAG